MRRKQQEEEEQREKDEVEAQKRREARARRPVRCLHSMRLASIREGLWSKFEPFRCPTQVEAEKQAASGLAKMGLVDPSLRKKEHGPRAAAKKAQRLYNSVVHGVADKRAEQQETSNMTQSRASVFLGALTPSTRVVSRNDGRGWSLVQI